MLGGAGRHDLVGIVAGDPANQLARLWLAGRNGNLAGLGRSQRRVSPIQSQFRLACCVVRTMTFEAMPRQDRSNVASKLDCRLHSGLILGRRNRVSGPYQCKQS
jgi:hypothetical protein